MKLFSLTCSESKEIISFGGCTIEESISYFDEFGGLQGIDVEIRERGRECSSLELYLLLLVDDLYCQATILMQLHMLRIYSKDQAITSTLNHLNF
jgi:hypothetical protein